MVSRSEKNAEKSSKKCYGCFTREIKRGRHSKPESQTRKISTEENLNEKKVINGFFQGEVNTN